MTIEALAAHLVQLVEDEADCAEQITAILGAIVQQERDRVAQLLEAEALVNDGDQESGWWVGRLREFAFSVREHGGEFTLREGLVELPAADEEPAGPAEEAGG